jgi:Tfp pilus assembly PilM family ATPase
MLKFDRMRPPVRRVLAIDTGSRCIRLLLAESDFGRLRILKEELIDLQEEGLVAADEIQAHLESVLDSLGHLPLALILPQHLSISQVLDLPLAPESEAEKLIQDETVKLGGVSESRIVYDFVRIETAVKNRQQYWVTLAQEGDIRERIAQLGVEQEDLCEVTTTANALITAYRAASPPSARAILVHLGAQTTVVVVVLAGQGVFATSFQMGGDFFTRSLARIRNCSPEAAESLKRGSNLLDGPERNPEFAGVVDGWVAELKGQLNEWFERHPELAAEAGSFELVASGGGFDQPGLFEHLRSQAGLELREWPKSTGPDAVIPRKGFEAAHGAALQALGHSVQPVSLLPDDYRIAWQKRLRLQRIEIGSLALAVVCLLLLAFGTWHQMSLISRKEALLAKVRAGQESVEANDALAGDLAAEYESFRPLFASQQNTLDTLSTMGLLEQSRSNRNFWYVLLADQQTYFNRPPGPLSTNKPVMTNLFTALVSRAKPFSLESASAAATATNLTPARAGFIAELCIPEDADSARKTRRQLVDELKEQRLFSKVDLLSDDLRRQLANPPVIIPDRDFVLVLDFTTTEFQQPLPPRKPLPGSFTRLSVKRPARPSPSSSESSETFGPIAP